MNKFSKEIFEEAKKIKEIFEDFHCGDITGEELENRLKPYFEKYGDKFNTILAEFDTTVYEAYPPYDVEFRFFDDGDLGVFTIDYKSEDVCDGTDESTRVWCHAKEWDINYVCMPKTVYVCNMLEELTSSLAK